MAKKFHKRLGGFIRAKALTSQFQTLYDVIAVNQKTGTLQTIGKVSSVDEAKNLAKEQDLDGFKFYMLENNTVLTELV